MQFLSSCPLCGVIVRGDEKHACDASAAKFPYQHTDYINTLETLIFQPDPQHLQLQAIKQEPTYQHLQDRGDYALKEMMERPGMINELENKNKLFQAHMQMRIQSQLLQNQMQLQYPFSQSYPPLQSALPQYQQQYTQLQSYPHLTHSLPPSPQLQQGSPQQYPQQQRQQPNFQQMQQMQQQMQQLQMQQVQLHQLQHIHTQKQKTEAAVRNKEKLSLAVQLPYGWRFDPTMPLVSRFNLYFIYLSIIINY